MNHIYKYLGPFYIWASDFEGSFNQLVITVQIWKADFLNDAHLLYDHFQARIKMLHAKRN